ncbi:MAG: helix-turn-helix transcriptional regulator [Clostridia bacterium]|nr:helix-turn-helix transcriptional regulator [Clostridia bacterium]
MEENKNKTLHFKIRELRKFTGRSQSEVAQDFFVSRACWSNYECGKRQLSIETIRKIADYFNVDINYLLDDADSDHDIEEFVQRRAEIEKNLSKDGQLSLSELTVTNKISLMDYYMFLKKKELKIKP